MKGVFVVCLIAFCSLLAQNVSGNSISVDQYNLSVVLKAPGTISSGKFVNGDTWVVYTDGLMIEFTAPAWDMQHNGFELNPASITQQGFDHRIAGFNASRVPSLPCPVSAGDRFVKALSKPAGEVDHNVALLTAIVIVIVPSPPPSDAFRTPYFGASPLPSPTSYWRFSQLDLNNFDAPPLTPPPTLPSSEIPTWEWMAARFQRVQLDHLTNWVSREIHPSRNLPDYGADIALDTGSGGIRLLFSDNNATKVPNSPAMMALVGYVQQGLDWYSILANGGKWPANGGHDEGRKLPIIFAGVALDDDTIVQAASSTSNTTFQETSEINLSPNLPSSTPLWGQEGVADEEGYWKVVVTGDGDRIERDPYQFIDGGAFPSSFYQYCCNSMTWQGTATPLLVSEKLKQAFNSAPFLEYVHRWYSFGAWAQPDPCAPPTGTCSTTKAPCVGYFNAPCANNGTCVLSMDGYGKDFGPDGSGGCIKDKDASDGIGRFPSLHGAAKNQGDYCSPFTKAMYDKYVQEMQK